VPMTAMRNAKGKYDELGMSSSVCSIYSWIL